MPFCSNCGHQLADGTKFCPNCGATTTQSEEGTSIARKQVYAGEIRKCPNCGEPLKAFEAVCPTCGYELRGTQAVGAVQEFAQKLEQIEAQRKTVDVEDPPDKDGLSKTDEQKINLIRNFVVPNTKEDIFEFLILASSNMSTMQNIFDLKSSYSKTAVCEAWEAKFDQVYNKAKLTFGTEKDFEKIQEIYRKARLSGWKKNLSQAIRSFLGFASGSPILAIGLILLLGGYVMDILFPYSYSSLLILCGLIMLIVAAVRRGKKPKK